MHPWYLAPVIAERPALLRAAAALLRAHLTTPNTAIPAFPHPRAALAWEAFATPAADAIDAWATGRTATAPAVPAPADVLDARGEPTGPLAWIVLTLTFHERGPAVAALEAIGAALELARCDAAAVPAVVAVLVSSLADARGCDAARIAHQFHQEVAR